MLMYLGGRYLTNEASSTTSLPSYPAELAVLEIPYVTEVPSLMVAVMGDVTAPNNP